MTRYANPDILIETDELADRIDDPALQVVEVDVDTALYDKAHIPGAVGWDWTEDLNHPVRRDIVDPDRFQQLLRESGISQDTTVVLYGDNDNWFAAFALWLLEYHGHDQVRLLDGGRPKWLSEDRPITDEVPSPELTSYTITGTRLELRATRDEVLAAVEDGDQAFIDVRSPEEFTGEVIAPPGLDETAQRGGHIPGATNVPWVQAVADDGTFRSREELEEIYGPVLDDEDTIVYCRIGERSSHSWFVLRHLLGLDQATNYDGSWTEYGNLIGVPVETGA